MPVLCCSSFLPCGTYTKHGNETMQTMRPYLSVFHDQVLPVLSKCTKESMRGVRRTDACVEAILLQRSLPATKKSHQVTCKRDTLIRTTEVSVTKRRRKRCLKELKSLLKLLRDGSSFEMAYMAILVAKKSEVRQGIAGAKYVTDTYQFPSLVRSKKKEKGRERISAWHVRHIDTTPRPNRSGFCFLA